MRRVFRTSPLTADDWLVDVWFRGLRTGKTIHRRIGVSPKAAEADVLRTVFLRLGLTDPRRVIDAKARRRHEVQTEEAAREMVAARPDVFGEMAARFARSCP